MDTSKFCRWFKNQDTAHPLQYDTIISNLIHFIINVTVSCPHEENFPEQFCGSVSAAVRSSVPEQADLHLLRMAIVKFE
jgi:hypothetical protein